MSSASTASQTAHYELPVKGPSSAFAVLFFVSGVLHVWQNNIQRKSYRIGFLFPWAAAIFTAGFVLREIFAFHPDTGSSLAIAIASAVLIFAAPPVYNGANYFVFGRTLYYLPYLAPIHPGRVWSTFIGLDTLAEIIAASGISRYANPNEPSGSRRAGLILVKVSLFLLIAMFLGFVVLNVHLHVAAKRAKVWNHNLQVILYTLYASNFLLLLRNCFRTAAAFYPPDSTANGKEWPLWVFEVVPMVINTYLFNIYPPSRYLPATHKVYLAVDGKTELEGPGMVDKRPFITTVLDPFDILGLVTGRDRQNRFWERDGIGGPLVDSEGTDHSKATSVSEQHPK